MIEVNSVLFVFLCIFATIGFLIVAFITLYVVAGIFDLTYQQRHKKEECDCPEKVESEGDDK